MRTVLVDHPSGRFERKRSKAPRRPCGPPQDEVVRNYFFSMFQNTGIGLVTMPDRPRVAVGRVYWPRWMCVP